MNDIINIKHLFEKEFGSLSEKFVIIELQIDTASDSQLPYIANPGVYVYWHPRKGVIKVGRHLNNSRKRALEHIRDNTGGTMAELLADNTARLLLFNVRDEKDVHWVAALEVYFESTLQPKIRSERLG